jgi:hypothetical protein
MRTKFTVALPNMLQHIVQTALIIFIPMIIASNEIASFIGISRCSFFCSIRFVVSIIDSLTQSTSQTR